MTTLGPDLQTTLEHDSLAFHLEHYRPAATGRLSLVMAHGFSAYCGLYRHVGRALAARGIAVTQFDGRGHGRSEGRRGHVDDFDDYVGDLAAVVNWAREQTPGLPWALMGHSLGGAIAAALALDERRSDRPARLVMAAPWLKLKMKVAPPKRMAANVVARILPTFSMPNGIRGENISRNPAVVEGFDHDPLVHHTASAGWFMTTLRAQARLRTHAQALKVPTLMLLAGQDRIVANEANLAFAQAAGATVTVRSYPELFHEVFLEPEAATVIDDVAAWLGSTSP